MPRQPSHVTSLVTIHIMRLDMRGAGRRVTPVTQVGHAALRQTKCFANMVRMRWVQNNRDRAGHSYRKGYFDFPMLCKML